ncbi:MAG: Ig-like domain-containing protein [Actinomycetota bacterium]|jgi:lipoprotein-anchoring transpeptidase ErfK/SrfK
MPRARYGIVLAAVAALAGISVVRFVAGSEAATDRADLAAANGAAGEAGRSDESDVAPAPAVTVDTDTAGAVPSDRPVVVRLANGTLTAVAVEDGQGQPLAGELAADGVTWQSSEPPVPLTPYKVLVTAVAADQRPFEQTLDVTSGPPSAVLQATLSPIDGEVVGIGMPAVVALNRSVAAADRPAVEQRLSVTTNPPVEGDWRWITPARVHWRPATYWQPGTEVSVRSDLRGLKVGGAWGADTERTIRFRIGPAHVSTVDVATHQMTVKENGQVVKVMPASMGQPKWPTHHGIHLVLEKSRQVTMDSSTIGIPRNGPGGYYRKVAWATRLTYSGEFVHAAPWSQWAQGKRNVSHGCINVSTANAKWFYDFSQRGDIVEVVNSPKKPKLYDPGTSDWNIPWEQWKVGDTAA